MEFTLQYMQLPLSSASWTQMPENLSLVPAALSCGILQEPRGLGPCHLAKASLGLMGFGLPFVLLLLLGIERVSEYWCFPSTGLESDSLCKGRELISNSPCL